MSRVRWLTLAACCLLIAPGGARGQVISESEAAVFVGCYAVEVGDWSVETAAEMASDLPTRVELEGPPLTNRSRQSVDHVRTPASIGGAVTVRSRTGESVGGWSWMTTNARSVRIGPPGEGFALLGALRADGRLEGRALPARARLADTERDDFAWVAVTLVPVECAGAMP